MSTAEAQRLPLMTADEFLNWDGGGHSGKLELVHGEILAMAPASGTHALLQAKLARLIGNHLESRKSPCRVGTETPIQPRINARHNIRAPDLAVTCLPPSGNEQLFPDPVLIAEILSPSNKRDSWESILACITIPTVKEVLVVDSERVYVEVLTKDADGAWPPERVTVEAGGIIRLSSIDATLAIAEIYADTHLAGQAA